MHSSKSASNDRADRRYITTITQTTGAFVEDFHVQHEQMECSDGDDAGQSMQYKKGIDQYVSLSDCERACQVEEQCNGMIEYGLNICTEKEIDPNSGLMECTAPYSADAPGGPRDGRCVEEDKCEYQQRLVPDISPPAV